MKGDKINMTHSKMQKESLKSYKHSLVTKEDLNPIWTEGLTEKLSAQLRIVKEYDIPFCLKCEKFAGDLIGTCTAYKLPEKTMQEVNKIKAVEVCVRVSEGEAEYIVDADRFELTSEYFTVYKGEKRVGMFRKQFVHNIRIEPKPVMIIGNKMGGMF